MTGWCFNLRSGSYSDSEDDTEPDNTHTSNSIPPNATDTNTSPQNPGSGSPDTASTTRQNETSRELKELFGGFEDEAILNYKPNPWNIAKMNANARASAPGLAKPAKPALKHVEIKAAGNKRFFFSKAKGAGGKLGNIARSSAKKPSPLFKKTGTAKKSLRDSISAALRREITSATKPSMDTLSAAPTLETDIESPLPNTLTPNEQGVTSVQAFQSFNYSDSLTDAYIPYNDTMMPQLQNSPYPYTPNTNKFPFESIAENVYDTDHTPAFTSDDPYSEAFDPMEARYNTSSTLDPFETPMVEPRGGLDEAQYETELNYPISPIGIPDPSPKWITQPATSGYTDTYTRNQQDQISMESFSDYTPAAPLPVVELSPTLQLLAKFSKPRAISDEAAYYGGTPQSEGLEHSQGTNNYEGSPVFAWYPPSPTQEEARSQIKDHEHQHTPSRVLKDRPRVGEVDSSKHVTSHNARRLSSSWQPITPPNNSAKKSFVKPIPAMDFDEKPIWSTLPSRRGAKQVKTPHEVTTARFRLPGTFLGSSPLSDRGTSTGTKALYKPPMRKRTRSGSADAEEGSRWKVTRIV